VRAVLITQCVQNDFVRPLAEGEPLPNLVHVGRLEAERLCGSAGALVWFLDAAHALPPERLAIVHVADRHDPRRHAAHFELFRPHCLDGSPGAHLVDPIGELAARRPGTRVVDAGDLNDFEDSPLASTLTELLEGEDPSRTRIAVIGVWTDAKVAFLLYDLATRLRARQLATCSALTASRSMDAHFRGLESLSSILGVRVLHSPGALLDWLVPDREAAVPRPPVATLRFARALGAPAGWGPLEAAERDWLLGHLTGDRTELTPLGGGFSGAQVLLARPAGRPARILKVGARDEIARERFGNERVARVLGDVVPRLLAYREGARLAAMELELAASDDPLASAPATFKQIYESDPSEAATELLEAALQDVLGGALARFYRTAEKDNADLLEVYGFTDRTGRVPFADHAIANAEAVARANGSESARGLLEAAGLPEPWLAPERFYREWLPGRSLTREVYPSLVHGDLNLANLLLSRRPGESRPARAWVIDFARLARLPSLTDCAKVENDLAYILFPMTDAAAQTRALALQERRLGSPTLEADLLPLAQTPEELRHARLVEALRRVAARLDPRGPAAMADYRVALLRYAVHTLGFDEPSHAQRRLALLACARLAGLLADGR
jgi:nicotinamidase-related amidase